MFNDIMLDDTQVYAVRRIEDNALIEIHWTRGKAMTVANEYEAQFDEPCRIGVEYINDRPQSLEERKANDETDEKTELHWD